MPFLFIYLIKLSLAITIFYGMYRFALRPLTFYKWNRYFLCGYGLFSLLLPFVNIDFLLPGVNDSVITSIPAINYVSLDQLGAASHSHNYFTDYPSILLFVFAIGATYVICRIIVQYRSLVKIRKAAVLIDSEDVELYDVDADISPFSFNNSIYFNSSLHPADELAKILQHEFVHVKQKHTIDLFIAEFLCIINWFNPFVWLLRKSIRQNLEFIADQQVLESGVDAKQYQYLLLKVTGVMPLGLTNHFNISSLKTRIAMMNKMRTAKIHLLKFLFVLPLLSVVLVSFRNASASSKTNLVEKAMPYEVAARISNDTPPPPPPPLPPPMGVRKGNAKLAEPGKLPHEQNALPADVNSITVSQKLTVKRKDGKTEVYDLSSPEARKAYEKKYGILVPPPPPPPPMPRGSQKEIPVPVQPDGSAALNADQSIKKMKLKGSEPLMILDGKVLASGSELNNVIDPDNIESIQVLKDASATALYGEKAANGVILIVSKTGNSSARPAEEGKDTRPIELSLVNVSAEKENGQGTIKAGGLYNKKDKSIQIIKDFKGLILQNGKEISNADLEKLDPDTIKSIDVIKDATATSKYGKKGENGVILLTIK
ncbi:MAG: TonB-dependent receptor plug domain-containing protein [Chitinophagaceae bacterium]